MKYTKGEKGVFEAPYYYRSVRLRKEGTNKIKVPSKKRREKRRRGRKDRETEEDERRR